VRLRTIVALVAILVTVLPSPARAAVEWVRRGTDPADVNCGYKGVCTGFDVLSSTVRILRTDEGRRFLTITLRARVSPGDWKSGIALDTRGNRRADRFAFLGNPLGAPMPQGNRCGVKRAGSDSEPRRGAYSVRRLRKVQSCRFPLQWFAPTKPIRWRVITEYHHPEPYSTIDRAPDRGWYP
jgi:hypothetical protein